MSRLPITRDVRIAQDMKAGVFEDLDLNLVDLHIGNHGPALGVIMGRTFRGCRVQGPGVILLSSSVHFNDCNFGEPSGDMRNLILFPAGGRALGTIPLRDCLFEGCEFFNVAFTGPRDILDQLLAVGSDAT